jgi:hypothetical protein
VPTKTTTDNFLGHSRGIDPDGLPNTLKDAILLAKKLGIDYLWVDALCIIQTGDDGKDWAEQAFRMTDIYERGLLNISALDGRDSTAGLRVKKLDEGGIRIGTQATPSQNGGPEDVYLFGGPVINIHPETEDRPLSKRGWAFQERLVSPATLHFTDCGMIWECRSTIETEVGWPKISRKAFMGGNLFFADSSKQLWKHANEEGHGLVPSTKPEASLAQRMRALDFWYFAVESYSEKDLTYQRDRLPALAGVASRTASKFGFTYLAGIWKEDIARGLCWRVSEPRSSQDAGWLPSWSWAGAGQVMYRFREGLERPISKIEILATEIDEESPGMLGGVRKGRLDIQGMTWRLRFKCGIQSRRSQ